MHRNFEALERRCLLTGRLLAEIGEPRHVVTHEHTAYVFADTAIWSTDGTSEQTTNVYDEVSPLTTLISTDNGVFFVERVEDKALLWSVADRSSPVLEVPAPKSSSWSDFRLVELGNALLFSTPYDRSIEQAIWRIDSDLRSQRIADVSLSDRWATMDGIGYFFDHTERKLWRTDGTIEGTFSITDEINTRSPIPKFSEELVLANGKLIFAAYRTGLHVWVSDGTAEGTRRLMFDTEHPFLGVSHIVPGHGGAYFNALTWEEGMELHFTDGTDEGSYMMPQRWEERFSASAYETQLAVEKPCERDSLTFANPMKGPCKRADC